MPYLELLFLEDLLFVFSVRESLLVLDAFLDALLFLEPRLLMEVATGAVLVVVAVVSESLLDDSEGPWSFSSSVGAGAASF